MTKRTNRREQILEAATQLFVEKGYTATSVREIADQVGCTEAAIYYHFKDGKRELLKAVVEAHIPELMSILDACREAESLPDLVMRFGQQLGQIGSRRTHNLRWIVAEFPRLDEAERAHFHDQYLAFHRELASFVRRFVDQESRARRVAWTVICASLGYAQLFYNLDMQSVADFSSLDLAGILVESLASS